MKIKQLISICLSTTKSADAQSIKWQQLIGFIGLESCADRVVYVTSIQLESWPEVALDFFAALNFDGQDRKIPGS